MTEKIEPLDVLAGLNAPPDSVPSHPPTSTRQQVLPFGELTWENFERLCYRIASQDKRAEHVARYGRQGQAQHGIDIFVRLESGKYEVWQAKRYAEISAAEVKEIVKKFREGSWSAKTDKLVLAVQASLADTKVQDAIEEEAESLKGIGITFIPIGGDELSNRLRNFPEIIDDFFGRDWVRAFLGPEAAALLGTRLDGAEFSRLRDQLYKYYNASFHNLDVGVSLPFSTAAASKASPSLLQRFAVPDVLVRDAGFEGQPHIKPNGAGPSPKSDLSIQDAEPSPGRRREFVRRVPLTTWLLSGRHLAILGEAGSGKSTLLRCVALDLLTNQSCFGEISRRWGGLIPIHLSFSRWSRLSARKECAVGLKELVAELLQPNLTADLISLLNKVIDEKRVLLLLDGLDEWSDEQAARTTLQYMLTFVAAHDVAAIVTARPRGLDKIGAVPNSWTLGELAPLSLDQQCKLARVWFERSIPGSTLESPDKETKRTVDARLDRFFVELSRDPRLEVLAGTPLLLVGLVALSLRQITLPRNRVQAINSLVNELINSHPVQRATAAGDTQSRFPSIPDADERRSAIARLAFVARSATGGGTYEINEARKTIRDFLEDRMRFGYLPDRAQRAAEELLAVNAETVGLLAERAPGEVGFAHAVFEEFLAAEHIRSWSFDEVLTFASVKSADPLWLSVISNLLSLLERPTEVQKLIFSIAAARDADSNHINRISRDILLSEIAFTPSCTPLAAAEELAARAFSTIEQGTWPLARRTALKSALTNLGDDSTETPVDARLSRWSPRRQKYLKELFDVLSTWPATADLEETLIGGLFDEERYNQRSAARALAHAFYSRPDTQSRLLKILQSTLDLSVAAAALEALSIGWCHVIDLSDLHDRAARSLDPTLRLVGITGRVATGRSNDSDRDALIELLSEVAKIDYWDVPSARELLSRNWKDDPTVIDLALAAAARTQFRRTDFERDSAKLYLLSCSPIISSVSTWVRNELNEEFPFAMLDGNAWDRLAPFAKEHDDIRAALVSLIMSEKGYAFLHYYQPIIHGLRDDEIRDFLISKSRVRKNFGQFWAIRALVNTWGRSDSLVAELFDEASNWDDELLENIALFLPTIITDKNVCRAKLFTLLQRERARFDLIAQGFASLGCTSSDDDVVDAILAKVNVGAPMSDPSPMLFQYFSDNARVRKYANEALNERSPELAIIARAYKDDPEVRTKILKFSTPLPTYLRGEIKNIAAHDVVSRKSLHSILAGYDIEIDSEIKIASSIFFHRHLIRKEGGVSEEHLARLRKDLKAVGPDYHERRAAAFAGMLILGRHHEVVPMSDFGENPMKISLGAGYGEESESLMALMAEHWDELSSAFGSELASRFGDLGSDEAHMWECLAPHLSGCANVRRDFLRFADRTNSTLGVRGLMALAREMPSSEVLLRHCLSVFVEQTPEQLNKYSPWAVHRLGLEAAYTLRDHYRDRPDVLSSLHELATRGQFPSVIALSLLSPTNPLLDKIKLPPVELGRRNSDWVTAVHLASARSNPSEFVQVVFEMVARPVRWIWDFQEFGNRVIVERIARDGDAAKLLKERLLKTSELNEIASLPRYLSAAGVLDSEINRRCNELLERESLEPFPRAGYDAVADSVTALSRSLLEAISPSFST